MEYEPTCTWILTLFPKELLNLKWTTGFKKLWDPIQPICGVKWEQENTDVGMSMLSHTQFKISVKSICGESTDTCWIVDELQAHYAKKPDTKRSCIVWFYLYEISKKGKPDRKQIGGCQVLGGKWMGVTAYWERGFILR